MRRLFIMIMAAASVALLGGTAWAAGSHGHHPVAHGHKSASCRASGTAASCTVGATVHRPGVIRVHVTARRNQDVTVSWAVTCTRGATSGSASGTFTARTPVSRKLSEPLRHPRTCMVSAAAKLAKSGHLHAWLTPRG
jgi:hypothetical protein